MPDTPRLLSLTIENVMRVKAVRLKFDPKGELKILGGGNGQGKTSVLKALGMALGGGAAQVDEPIRKGQKGAKVIVDLDAFTVTRNWTSKGTYLTVKSKDGRAWPSPQSMLDGLFSSLGFDPLAFAEKMSSKEQADTLKALVGIDFTALDARHKEIFDERTIVSRDVKTYRGQLVGLPEVEAPEAEVSISELATQITDANQSNLERSRAMAAKAVQVTGAATMKKSAADKREAAAELLEEADECDVMVKRYVIDAEAITVSDEIDTGPIRDRIDKAEATNAAVRQKQARAKVIGRLAAATEQVDDLTSQLNAIDAEKENTLAAAEFPVPGLGFDETGVTFNNLPFSQAGNAEKLRVSVAIGLKGDKSGLKLATIDDGERLDLDGLKLITEEIAKVGGSVLMARVSEGDECSCIIEDGEIAEAKE